jgi:hypothetical protein
MTSKDNRHPQLMRIEALAWDRTFSFSKYLHGAPAVLIAILVEKIAICIYQERLKPAYFFDVQEQVMVNNWRNPNALNPKLLVSWRCIISWVMGWKSTPQSHSRNLRSLSNEIFCWELLCILPGFHLCTKSGLPLAFVLLVTNCSCNRG